MATLNDIQRPEGVKRAYRRIGRGQSSTRGKQSGRGGKGQTARAGNKRRPELRDIIKKLPKRRGFGKNRARTVNPLAPRPLAVSLATLEKLFPADAEVTAQTLVERGAVPARAGRTPRVKIIGSDALTKKLVVKGCVVSAGARATIEKAGGAVEILSSDTI